MAEMNDLVSTAKLVCEACFRGGTVVEMETIDNVTQGNKRKCPTCTGTWSMTLIEQEWPAAE